MGDKRPPSLSYKREGDGGKRDPALVRTKCCRIVTEFFSVVLHSFLCAGSREADFAPWNARVLPADSPSRSLCAQVIRVGICLAVLIGCNHSNCLHIFINIHILVFFCSVSCSTCVFCVVGPLSRVLLCPYVCECLSLPFLTYSSVQDPGGPASFPTHARSNVTTRTERER